MISITKETAGSIPVLHIVKAENKDKKLPFILFLHGFTSAKEHNLHYAYLYAEEGYRVVLPEAKYHGERSGISESQLMFHFWDIVLTSIEEASLIKDFFVEKGMADENRIGLAGTSMGAITVLGALTQYDWVKAAVSLMGSPQYEKMAKAQIAHLKEVNVNIPFNERELEAQFKRLRPFDLSQNINKLKQVPILFWHGKKDPLVPYHFAREFYDCLQQSEEENEQIVFITDQQASHKVSRQGVLKSVEWFKKWL